MEQLDLKVDTLVYIIGDSKEEKHKIPIGSLVKIIYIREDYKFSTGIERVALVSLDIQAKSCSNMEESNGRQDKNSVRWVRASSISDIEKSDATKEKPTRRIRIKKNANL